MLQSAWLRPVHLLGALGFLGPLGFFFLQTLFLYLQYDFSLQSDLLNPVHSSTEMATVGVVGVVGVVGGALGATCDLDDLDLGDLDDLDLDDLVLDLDLDLDDLDLDLYSDGDIDGVIDGDTDGDLDVDGDPDGDIDGNVGVGVNSTILKASGIPLFWKAVISSAAKMGSFNLFMIFVFVSTISAVFVDETDSV